MIRRLKIGKKLFLLAGSLSAIALIIVVTSLVIINEVNGASTNISKFWIPSVVVAEEINTMTSDYRILELNHILSVDAATMADYDKQISAKRTAISDEIASYTSLVSNDTDKAMIESIQSVWNVYLKESDQVLVLSRNNQNTDALTMIRGDSQANFDKLSKECLNLVQFNKAGADQASAHGNQLYTISLVVFTGTEGIGWSPR
jgi:methyl-accepting chemotaxis protein